MKRIDYLHDEELKPVVGETPPENDNVPVDGNPPPPPTGG